MNAPTPRPLLRACTPNTYRALLSLAIATALATSALAQPHQVGFKMGVDGLGNLQNTSTNGALLPTDIAGPTSPTYYAQSNWNVLGRYGNNSTNIYAITNADQSITIVATTNAFSIFDSAGDDTHLTIHWDATGNYSQQGGGTPVAQASPDGNLMNGFCDSGGNANLPLTNASSIFGQSGNNKPLVYIGGLQAWLATESSSAYDVLIYADGDTTAGRTGEYWIQSATNGPSTGPTTNLWFGADLTTHAFICDRANFVTTFSYVQEPLASVASWVSSVPGFGGGDAGWGSVLGGIPGNFLVFPGLTNDSFVIRTEEFRAAGGTLRSPINAIQIVPRTTAPPPPELASLADCQVYAGGTAVFRALAGGAAPLTYYWQKGGSPLTDSGNVSGSSTANLTISGVSIADQASYTVIVSNINGTATASAPLTLISYTANSFAEEVATNHAYAYWRFNESADPSTNYTVAHDSMGRFNGVYGLAAQNGFSSIVGPEPSSFPGFESGNTALQTYSNSINSWVIAPPLRLNTNTVTMCAWVFPTAYYEPPNCGVIFTRTTNNDVCGINYYGTTIPNSLGYTWNGASATFNFQSFLTIPSNIWSFIGLEITPSNAVLWVYNTNGLFNATNNVTNAVCSFTGPTCIGVDPSSANTPQTRSFVGSIDEVAVFNYDLSAIEIYNLYKKSLHQSALPPLIVAEPPSLALYTGRTARFTVQASGDPFLTLTYQWQKDGGTGPTNLSNGGNISGANSATLVIANVGAADVANYYCVVANGAGSLTTEAANLAVVNPPTPLSAYEAALQALNPLDYWRFNEASGSVYAYDYWGGIIASNYNVTTAQLGPQPADFPGFESTNTAYSYDGTDSYTETSRLLLNNQPQFTDAGWFNMPAYQFLRTGLFGQDDAAEFGFHGLGPDGLAQLGIWTVNGGATYLNQTLINLNQWYFTAATGDGTNLNLYLFSTNGTGGYVVYQSSVSGSTTNYGSGTGTPYHIGGGGILDTSSNYFNGLIDEVAIWRRALSGGELASLFATSIGVSGLPPQVTAQPASKTLYVGRPFTLSVTVLGSSPLAYQWRTNGVALPNGGSVSGATSANLLISSVSNINVADYDCVITNSYGSITSSVASLNVIVPTPGGYESVAISLNPVAYYRLNETNDPSLGTAPANDYWGGNVGTYGLSASNGFQGILGPQPPEYIGFDANNYALASVSNNIATCVTNNFGTLNTNMATFTMWINPTLEPDSFCGLEINRSGNNPGGFGYTGGHLGYTWNNNNAATYNATWSSNLVPPLNQWSFVALVVTPTNAVVYMTDPANPNNLLSANTAVANSVEAKTGTWYIGADITGANRTFNGRIDEVAVFDYSLTPSQIALLNSVGYAGAPVSLKIQLMGGQTVLSWGHGTLLQAPSAFGPWTTNTATSPYTNTLPSGTTFYRTILR